ARIRQYAATDTKGTTVLGLIAAAEQIGFIAPGVKGTIEHIQQVPLPAIAHIVIGAAMQHYVVLYKVGKHRVRIMDPADGKLRTLTLETFKRQWTGVLLLAAPGETFQRGSEKQPT